MVDLDDEGLRRALEELPCCMTNKDGSGESDPLNIVVIGPEEEIWPAFITLKKSLEILNFCPTF